MTSGADAAPDAVLMVASSSSAPAAIRRGGAAVSAPPSTRARSRRTNEFMDGREGVRVQFRGIRLQDAVFVKFFWKK